VCLCFRHVGSCMLALRHAPVEHIKLLFLHLGRSERSGRFWALLKIVLLHTHLPDRDLPHPSKQAVPPQAAA
jgi:hypothetical protein